MGRFLLRICRRPGRSGSACHCLQFQPAKWDFRIGSKPQLVIKHTCNWIFCTNWFPLNSKQHGVHLNLWIRVYISSEKLKIFSLHLFWFDLVTKLCYCNVSFIVIATRWLVLHIHDSITFFVGLLWLPLRNINVVRVVCQSDSSPQHSHHHTDSVFHRFRKRYSEKQKILSVVFLWGKFLTRWPPPPGSMLIVDPLGQFFSVTPTAATKIMYITWTL